MSAAPNSAGRDHDVVDPTTETVIATVHHAGVAEVAEAVARAVVAQRR